MNAWPHRLDCSCASCEGMREPTGPLWRTLAIVLVVLLGFVWLVESAGAADRYGALGNGALRQAAAVTDAHSAWAGSSRRGSLLGGCAFRASVLRDGSATVVVSCGWRMGVATRTTSGAWRRIA